MKIILKSSRQETRISDMIKLLVSIGTIAAVLTASSAVEQQQGPSSPQIAMNKKHQFEPQAVNSDRQSRSIPSQGNTSNNGNFNTIDHSSSKLGLEQERRAVQEFLTPKNIVKSIVRLLFGNPEEVSATSRSVLSIVNKLLDLLKITFGQKSRSGGTARTIRDSAEDAASAGVSMIQGYLKSVLTQDGQCAKRYLCQASREAVRDSRDLGYVIATVGSYTSSYMLDSSKSDAFNTFYDASLKGRSAKEDCYKIYPDCAE